MSRRPADLPDFSDPPLTEVVVGVQLNGLDRFLVPHVGAVWDLFREEFDHVEEHPPLVPAFETFGQNPQAPDQLPFLISATFDMPRIFLVNRDRTRLLQLQRDRFIHNWRKTGDGDEYPRFESIVSTFVASLKKFADFVDENNLGRVEPTQCEVSYINQVIVPDDETFFQVEQRLFEDWATVPAVPGLGVPSDGKFVMRYDIPGPSGSPLGRLLVSFEPARRLDGTRVIQLILTARGAPVAPDIASVVAFVTSGRGFIVHGFKAVTSAVMHKKWGLQP